MTVLEEYEEPQIVEKKPWVPRVLTGGKGPPEPPTEDWLSPLEVGTTFVTRINKNTVDYELYYVMFKGDDCVLLKWQLPDGKIWDRHVSPKAFCKHYREYEVLGVHKPEPEEAAKQPEEIKDDRGECNQG